jgi:hypothetical protein
MTEQPLTVDMLYVDAEHFVLTAEATPPLEPKTRVTAAGEPFPGLFPREDSKGPVRPDEEPTT